MIFFADVFFWSLVFGVLAAATFVLVLVWLKQQGD